MNAPVPPGQCADIGPGLFSHQLSCTLLSGHAGMHHDELTGADWYSNAPDRRTCPACGTWWSVADVRTCPECGAAVTI